MHPGPFSRGPNARDPNVGGPNVGGPNVGGPRSGSITPLRALAGLVQWLFLADWRARLAQPWMRAAILLLALPLAAYLSFKAVGNQITETNLLREDRVSLASYLDGSAAKPFAYRWLNPLLIRAAAQAGAPALFRALPGPIAGRLPDWCAHATASPPASCDDVAAYASVAGAEFFAFLLLVGALCWGVWRNPLVALFGVGFAFFGTNAVLLQNLSHVYDFGVLLWVSLLLLCLQRGWALAFTLLLPLAFLTKETLILYAGGFFLADLGRRDSASTAGYFIVQIASFVLLHGLVRWHFQDNPGLGHEYYLPEQIHFFTEQISISWLIPMTTALVLIFYRFGDKPAFLRRASIVLAPWFVLFLIGGVEKELRVAIEVLPILLLLTIDSLVRLVPGLPPRSG